MSYRIVGDSCSDPTEAMKQDPHFRFVPLTLIVGDTHVTDDESFDQKAFLKLVAESPEGPKTACPSPEQYLREFECDADMVFAVTLSSKLSGSYQSAVIAKQMYEEHHGEDKKIFIVDSLSAGCGQTNICLRLQELCEEGKGPASRIVGGVALIKLKAVNTHLYKLIMIVCKGCSGFGN